MVGEVHYVKFGPQRTKRAMHCGHRFALWNTPLLRVGVCSVNWLSTGSIFRHRFHVCPSVQPVVKSQAGIFWLEAVSCKASLPQVWARGLAFDISGFGWFIPQAPGCAEERSRSVFVFLHFSPRNGSESSGNTLPLRLHWVQHQDPAQLASCDQYRSICKTN